MEGLDRNQFVFGTIVIGFAALMLSVTPSLLWWLYIKPQALSNSITYAVAPNYWNGWYAMVIGHLVAFAPPAIMYWPAYFSRASVSWYWWSWDWAMEAAQKVGLIVAVPLVIEAINTGTEKAATKSIWISCVLYAVFNMVVSALFVNFEHKAHIWYAWPEMEEMQAVEEDEVDSDEFNATATELLAKIDWF